jgi:adenylate cyclase
MAKLVLVSGEERQEFELEAHNSIGRHPDNTIQILDRIISKEHSIITRDPSGRFRLKDLGSLNGTYINGERATDQVLRDGDEITLGSTRLLYVEQEQNDPMLQRVTIAPGALESHIRQRITASDRDFRPEREIRDIEAIRRDYEKLRIAHELNRAVSLEFDLDRLLTKILDKAFELLPADRGVILLIDPKGELVPRVVKSKSGATENIVLSNSIINEVLREKAAVLSSDATMDSRFSGAHSIIMQGIRSTMCVPLLHAEELLGIMHLDSQIATNAFTEKDLQLFTGISSQAAVSIQNARLAKKIEEEAKTRAQFQRLLSPNLVEQVVKGAIEIKKGGEQKEVTVLFSDIRGFTAMSESRAATEIVHMLNEYFELMVEVVFRYEGTVDKFVGDELMAIWGAPVTHPEDPLRAVTAALDMIRTLEEFNRTRAAEDPNVEPIRIGIGINTGEAVVGAIGSSKTLQYTVIGDTVNTGARLCSVAKPGQIVVSEATARKLGDAVELQPLPLTRVKGKTDELRLWNVTGFRRQGTWSRDVTKPM